MIKRALLLFTINAVFFPSNAQAQILVKELSECYQKLGTLEKVACYDELARKTGAIPTVSSDKSTETGKWNVTTKTNPLDDSKTYTAVLEEEAGDRGILSDTTSIILRCKSDETEMYISWGDYLGDDGDSIYSSYKNVITRIGEQEAVTNRWSLSTNSQATFAPGSNIDLIIDLAKNDKFVAQTTPYNESPKTAVFNLTGINSVVSGLANTCGWKEAFDASKL